MEIFNTECRVGIQQILLSFIMSQLKFNQIPEDLHLLSYLHSLLGLLLSEEHRFRNEMFNQVILTNIHE